MWHAKHLRYLNYPKNVKHPFGAKAVHRVVGGPTERSMSEHDHPEFPVHYRPIRAAHVCLLPDYCVTYRRPPSLRAPGPLGLDRGCCPPEDFCRAFPDPEAFGATESTPGGEHGHATTTRGEAPAPRDQVGQSEAVAHATKERPPIHQAKRQRPPHNGAAAGGGGDVPSSKSPTATTAIAQPRPSRASDVPARLYTLAETGQVYQQALGAFELSNDTALSARREEENQIIRFWQHHVCTRTSAALYIYGSPGTCASLYRTRTSLPPDFLSMCWGTRHWENAYPTSRGEQVETVGT